MDEELTIEEQLELDAEADAAELEAQLASLEDEGAPVAPDEEPQELVAGDAVSLEQVLDTIFNILYTQSAQIQAIGEHVFGTQPAEPEVPALTVVTDLA